MTVDLPLCGGASASTARPGHDTDFTVSYSPGDADELGPERGGSRIEAMREDRRMFRPPPRPAAPDHGPYGKKGVHFVTLFTMNVVRRTMPTDCFPFGIRASPT